MLKTPRNISPRARILDPSGTDIDPPMPMNASGHTAVNWVFTASANGEYTFLFEALEDTVACSFFIYDVQITHVGQVLDCEGVQGYRYGYQGSEKDDEVKGEGNSYTTEFRMLDPRLGRWLSIDPLAAQFPWQSPYVSMDNNPIWFNDIAGDSTLSNTQPPLKTGDATNVQNRSLPTDSKFTGADKSVDDVTKYIGKCMNYLDKTSENPGTLPDNPLDHRDVKGGDELDRVVSANLAGINTRPIDVVNTRGLDDTYRISEESIKLVGNAHFAGYVAVNLSTGVQYTLTAEQLSSLGLKFDEASATFQVKDGSANTNSSAGSYSFKGYQYNATIQINYNITLEQVPEPIAPIQIITNKLIQPSSTSLSTAVRTTGTLITTARL